jgi:hypothetical protein
MTLQPKLRDNSLTPRSRWIARNYQMHLSAKRLPANWAMSFLRDEDNPAVHAMLANEVAFLTSLAAAYIMFFTTRITGSSGHPFISLCTYFAIVNDLNNCAVIVARTTGVADLFQDEL